MPTRSRCASISATGLESPSNVPIARRARAGACHARPPVTHRPLGGARSALVNRADHQVHQHASVAGWGLPDNLRAHRGRRDAGAPINQDHRVENPSRRRTAASPSTPYHSAPADLNELSWYHRRANPVDHPQLYPKPSIQPRTTSRLIIGARTNPPQFLRPCIRRCRSLTMSEIHHACESQSPASTTSDRREFGQHPSHFVGTLKERARTADQPHPVQGHWRACRRCSAGTCNAVLRLSVARRCGGYKKITLLATNARRAPRRP
jgi:hypothetical protein